MLRNPYNATPTDPCLPKREISTDTDKSLTPLPLPTPHAPRAPHVVLTISNEFYRKYPVF